jgi:hypothetical protein
MADEYDTPDPRNDQELIDGLAPLEHEKRRREAPPHEHALAGGLPSVEGLVAEWEKAAEGVTPGPWFTDSIKSDGSYGSGDDVYEGFDTYALYSGAVDHYGSPAVICDALNSYAGSIEEEFDEDGHHAWDEQARRNFEWFARCAPNNVLSALRSLSARLAEAERERGRCHARLEIDHAFKLEGDELVRFELPLAERSEYPDAVECRDATIAELERQLAKATGPEYLAGALEKVGVVDAEWKARAEAAEARASSLAAELAEIKKEAGR